MAEHKGFTQLKADLKAQQLQNAYIFYGEETYLRARYLQQVRQLLIPAGFEEFNDHHLSGKGLTVQTLTEVVEAMDAAEPGLSLEKVFNADGSEGSAMSHAAHMLYVAGNLPEEDISHS